MTGYVAMRRDWQDHDIFEGDEYSRRDAWAWLIANAAWKAGKARIKGAGVILARGELCFSQRFLAKKWGWSKSRVDRFLHTLRSEGMIEVRSKIGATPDHPAGQGQSIITICNFDKYQPNQDAKRGNDEPQTGATAGQQRGKEEEGKKGISIPEANASGADLEAVLFGQGLRFLTANGVAEPKARQMLGKWKRDHGPALVIQALSRAQREGALEPLSFIEACLRSIRQRASAVEGMPC